MRGNPNLHRPLHIIVHGDKSKAYRWIQWARNKLDRLQAVQWLGTKTYRPRRGIFVVIQSHAAQKKIIIWTFDCRLYMESGVLDMLEIAPLNPNTFKPAQLLFTDTIKADRGLNYPNGQLDIVEVSPGVLKGENRNEGESKALGCNEDDKIGSLVLRSLDPNSTDVKTFENASKPWCKNGEFLEQKRCQVLCPASVFTGLLQLHVQAVYGSKRRDYGSAGVFGLTLTGIDWTPEGWTPYQFSWRAATGLFRGANYSYWLIVLDLDGFRVRRMNPTGCGVQLRQWLISNGGSLSTDKRRQYEAYLLSTLEQDEDEGLVKLDNTSEAFELYTLGNPWYYGVHWNEDGSEGHVVLIRHKPGTSFQGSDNLWQSTHVRISVGEHSDKSLTLKQGRIFVSWGIVENTQDFSHRNNEDLVWWPNPIGGMECFVPKPFNQGQDVDSDVPMYCFYDRSWNLKVVRFTRKTHEDKFENKLQTQENGTVADLSGQGFPGPDPNNSYMACSGVQVYRIAEEADDWFDYGFYVDGGRDLRGEELGGLKINDHEGFIVSSAPTDLGTFGVTSGIYSLTLECHPSPPWQGQQAGQRVERWDASGGELNIASTGVGFEGLLAIPWYDASSVYLGSIREWNAAISGGKIISNGSTGVDASRGYRNSGGGVIASGQETRHRLEWLRPFTGQSDFKNLGVDEPRNFFNASGSVDFNDVRVYWVHRDGDERVYESAGDVNGTPPTNFYIPSESVLAPEDVGPGQDGLDAQFSWGGWNSLFDPPNLLTNPFTLDFVAAWQGYECETRLSDRSPDGSQGYFQEDFDFGSLASDYEFALVGHV